MFNLTIINIKDIKKYAIKIASIVVIVFGIIKGLPLLKQLENKVNILDSDLLGCLDTTCEAIRQTNNIESIEKKAYSDKFFEDVLKTQIGSIDDYLEAEEFDYENQIETTSLDIPEKSENNDVQPTNSELELARNKLANTSNNTRPLRIKIQL